MTLRVQSAAMPGAPTPDLRSARPAPDPAMDLRLRFEQMLWSEMLSHAGLEKAFTQGGGGDASAFSRFIVEAIAKDLAEKHPLGFGEKALAAAQPPATREGDRPE